VRTESLIAALVLLALFAVVRTRWSKFGQTSKTPTPNNNDIEQINALVKYVSGLK
jgi:hypothetical protein